MTRAVRLSAWALVAVLSGYIALFAYRYLVGIGPFAPNLLANVFRTPWLDLHVAGAATALLIGPLQLIPKLRTVPVHRWLGRIYVTGCAIGGVAAVLLAFGSTAGPVATAGFGLLGIVWLATTAMAWRLAVTRRYARHREWMIRSFALTFAAVMLRLYLPAAAVLGLPMLASYRAISFLCWVPNLIVAELILARGRKAGAIKR